MLIHATRFFREPDTLAALARNVVQRLADSRRSDQPIRVWICGCATGEEAYSMAMLLAEHLRHEPSEVGVQIIATDVSDLAIEHARAGLYPAAIAADVNPDRLRRFFTKSGDAYEVTPRIRSMCIFASHDVTVDPPVTGLDALVCRNVLIYLDTALQKKLIEQFHDALRAGGHLILGKADTPGSCASLLAPADMGHPIYRKDAPSDFQRSTFQ